MATNLLTTSSTVDERSGNVTVLTGTPVTVHLKGADKDARMVVEKRDDAAAWQPTGEALTAADPSCLLVGSGVYSVVRMAGTCGAFYD
jgi:hypothetical protein